MKRAREQRDRSRGDRNQCVICNPRDAIRYDRIVLLGCAHLNGHHP